MCCREQAKLPALSTNELRVSYRDTSVQIDNTFTLKVITIGESNVGKTNLVHCMEGKPFLETTIATIGVDLVHFTLEDRGKRYNVQLWDTAGQERFHTIVRSYYRATQLVLLCFSLVDVASMQAVAAWLAEARSQTRVEVRTKSGTKITQAHIIIVGTKLDLVQEDFTRSVITSDFLASISEFFYVETSAKTGHGLDILRAELLLEARRLEKARNRKQQRHHQLARQPAEPVQLSAERD